MKKERIDLTGQKFGRLTVKKYVYTEKNKAYWLCECDCGNIKILPTQSLRSHRTQSCGCFRKELQSTHGLSNSILYRRWHGMKQRCENIKDKAYKYYGSRGIKVCEEWQDFNNFYNWSLNNGYKKDLTLDRINVNGNYEPNNCRWTNWNIQMNNTRFNHLLEYNNEIYTISQWAKILGLNYSTLNNRIKRGWTIERAFTQKKQEKRRKNNADNI